MIRDAPVGDPIPKLTAEQRAALREYTSHYRQAEDTLGSYPLVVARVLARDKPAACVKPVSDIVPDGYDGHDAYLPDVFGRMGLDTCQIVGDESWYIARTAWRLDLLPTEAIYTEAYHRRCGVFFGYPPAAIEHFIMHPDVTVTHCDVARAGLIAADDLAYLIFISYAHEKTMERYQDLIARGKAIRRRLSELSETWDVPVLDAQAETVYQSVAAAYAGEGGLYSPPTTFPPDHDVTPSDVEPLLS